MTIVEIILIIKILILVIAIIKVNSQKMKIVGVYKITNVITGQYYVGYSKDIKSRLNQHFRDLDKRSHCNQKLQNAYNYFLMRTGYNIFIPEILHICNTDDEAKAIE